MAFCTLADGAAMFGATPIENMFLLEYLPTAPEGFVRVYLYARMLSLHPQLGGDLAAMARSLRMEEDAVYSAMAYWEQQGLVRRLTDRPPTYELLPVNGASAAAPSPMDQAYYQYRDYNSALQALFRENLMHPKEYEMASDWLNLLGLEQDAAVRLVKYCVEQSKSKSPKPEWIFKRANKLAVAWAERGVRTVEDVERAIAAEDGVLDTARAVLKQFSQRRQPSVDELTCVQRWTQEWKFTQADILAACAETTKASKPSFAYLDAVLRSRMSGEDVYRDELVAVLRELDPQSASPTPELIKRYVALRTLGFAPETVRLAAVQCHRKRKNRFEDLEWMLNKWAEQRLFSPEAAQAYVDSMRAMSARMRRVLEMCGLERRPNLDDLARCEAWSAVHDDAVIDYAAECARGMQMPVRYMDRLLSEWAASGIRTVEAARAQHEQSRANRPVAAAAGTSANPALDYAQRQYKESDFGDDFFTDLNSEYGEGGDRR